jgi:hypothetical protein
MDDGGFWVVDVIAAAVSRLGVLETLANPFFLLSVSLEMLKLVVCYLIMKGKNVVRRVTFTFLLSAPIPATTTCGVPDAIGPVADAGWGSEGE